MLSSPRRLSVVLFDRFTPLDVFGPLELLDHFPEQLKITMIGPEGGKPVTNGRETAVVAEASYAQAVLPDIVLVPGGLGTRSLVSDRGFLDWLHGWAKDAQIIASVCTGSALLAAAGLLDGYRATSNKRAFAWASSQGERVDWVTQARWVVDRNRWTSSGVAAGMDMAAALIDELFGRPAGQDAADHIELELHTDPNWDPFASLNQLQ